MASEVHAVDEREENLLQPWCNWRAEEQTAERNRILPLFIPKLLNIERTSWPMGAQIFLSHRESIEATRMGDQ